jgi:23S rRNA (uridine2552-2'-O)-methyltransferase
MASRRKNPYARPDARTRAAKDQGYPARSVFKLEEIDRRAALLRPGQRVLDLGAAPGSWTLYASRRIGPQGRVSAVDRQPLPDEIREMLPDNVEFIVADALAMTDDALAANAPFDVVLSDMAPSTSGSKSSDQARSFELFARALEVAAALGRPGSSFAGKLFMSEDFAQARRRLAELYEKTLVVRPEATRSRSSELFLVGLRLRKR